MSEEPVEREATTKTQGGKRVGEVGGSATPSHPPPSSLLPQASSLQPPSPSLLSAASSLQPSLSSLHPSLHPASRPPPPNHPTSCPFLPACCPKPPPQAFLEHQLWPSLLQIPPWIFQDPLQISHTRGPSLEPTPTSRAPRVPGPQNPLHGPSSFLAGPRGHISRAAGPRPALAAYQWLVPKDWSLRGPGMETGDRTVGDVGKRDLVGRRPQRDAGPPAKDHAR